MGTDVCNFSLKTMFTQALLHAYLTGRPIICILFGEPSGQQCWLGRRAVWYSLGVLVLLLVKAKMS